MIPRTDIERSEAAHLGVEIPRDLPAGCGVAYAWVHEDMRLAELGSDDPSEVEREIARALQGNAAAVAEEVRRCLGRVGR